jgi:hypothetical protein
MRQKIITILALFYSIQFIVSCCPDGTIENTIRGVSSRTLVLDQNIFVEVSGQDPINKEDLILEVLLTGDQINLGSTMNELKKLGMPSAYAAIDCDDQTIVYKNQVNDISIFAVDENSADVDITGDLVIQGTDVSIASYLSDHLLSVFDGFVVEFNNTDNLPNVASFRIEVALDDGNTVVTETNTINFN